MWQRITTAVVSTALVAFPALAFADSGNEDGELIEPPPEIEEAADDVVETEPYAGFGGGTFEEEGFALTLSAGLKGGVAGAGGYDVPRTQSVIGPGGREVPGEAGSTPSSDDFPHYSPEIYNHFGGGMNVGAVSQLRLYRFLSLEGGVHRSRDNASGYVEKNRDGQHLSTIHSHQSTIAWHFPFLVKLNAAHDVVRPFLGVGIQWVVQQRSHLRYSQEVHSERYATDDQLDELDRRNQIETSSYPVGLFAAGLEFTVGPRFLRFTIPIEFRAGYNLRYGDDFRGSDLSERARAEDGQLIYDGAYAGHFAIFTGVLYEFDMFE